MNYKLKYGKKEISLILPRKNVISVLELKNKSFNPVENIKEEFIRSLEQPLSCDSLNTLILKYRPESIAIVVEDITRANPYYPEILDYLINYISENFRSKIKFVIALGTHRPHTNKENIKLYGEEIVKKYKFINHDCDNTKLNEYIGTTSFGNKVYLNKNVVNADLVILTGSIDTHSFAGYSGTRKSLLPGVAARQTITFNHSFVKDEHSTMGEIKNNKLHLDMMSAANIFIKTKPTFVINFIKNDKKQLVKILAGELNSVYNEGIKIAKKIFSVPIKQLADVTIVSCGGYPRDINLYQAQKSLTCGTLATKKGGTIILLAECCEGIGQEIFGNWLMKKSLNEILNTPQNKIVVEGHRAYLTAKILKEYNCILISGLNKKIVNKLKFVHAKCLDEVISKLKNNLKYYIIPNGSSVLPILTNTK